MPGDNFTIVVKKADGTTARMTLAEIKQIKAGPTTTKPASSVPKSATTQLPAVVVDTTNMLPAKIGVVVPAVWTPLPVKPVMPAPAFSIEPKVSRSPDTALLEETVAPHEVFAPHVVQTRDYDALVTSIIKESKFTVGERFEMRARSLVMSWLKGVRGDEQFIEYATKALEAGGLGIDRAAAETTLAAMKRSQGQPMVFTTTQSLTRTTPVTAIFVDEARAASHISKTSAVPLTEVKRASARVALAPFDVSPGSAKVMHDIRPAAPARPSIMGPHEEMKSFGLNDYRRLAASARDAGEVLLHKFQGWKDESFLLFFETRAAWWESPLIALYEKITLDAMNTGTTIKDSITRLGRESLTETEFKDIVRVNRDLRYN